MSIGENIINWATCNIEQRISALQRPTHTSSIHTSNAVKEIITQVKTHGDQALLDYNAKFDRAITETLLINPNIIAGAQVRLSEQFKTAMAAAMDNIATFHQAQKLPLIDIETCPGVRCQQIIRPIETVGLYIPGGSAPLFSTVLMLAIPARIAGCKRVILCSPPTIADEILYAAQQCGVDEIFQIGGAQAIAAMAFGTQSIPQVDKIFGPGNAFVTEAKRQLSQYQNSAAIDMPAGPSEVLIIADKFATPSFIAADLLAQAEHGPDSQVLLVTPELKLANAVAKEIATQLADLPRIETTRQALKNSRLIIARDLAECVTISNQYGPEHLIIQSTQARELLKDIHHAGSIFLGDWSPESMGDYATGTNHVLPTYGYAKNHSCLGLADFQKRMTVQELSAQGFSQLAPNVEILAAAEQLLAHKNAVTLRLNALKRSENNEY